MRLRPFSTIRCALLSLTIAATPAVGQSLKAEDTGSRTAALAARIAAVRNVPSARDVVRLTAAAAATDSASLASSSVLTPYRSTPSDDIAPGGFSMRLPGTGLDLTNGSFSIRHANDGRYGKGIHFSVQLTY